MTAHPQDLYIEQGATYILAFQWRITATSIPINLTGYEARMEIRKAQGNPALVTATTANGKIVLGKDPDDEEADPDPMNGWVFVELSAEDTDLIINKTSKYDLELEDPSFTPARVYRLLQGTVTTDPNMTQVIPDDPPMVP